jgi:hypothetical protein
MKVVLAILAFAAQPAFATEEPLKNATVSGELACSVNEVKDGGDIAVTPETSVKSQTITLACTFRNFETQAEEEYIGTLRTVADDDQRSALRTLLWIVKTQDAATLKPGALNQRFEIEGSPVDQKAIALKGENESTISLVLPVDDMQGKSPSLVSFELQLASVTT